MSSCRLAESRNLLRGDITTRGKNQTRYKTVKTRPARNEKVETRKIFVRVKEPGRKVLAVRCHVWPGSNGTARALGRESVF